MPAPLRLEVFEQPDEPDAPSLMMPEDLEDLRLNAYERGYLAGWEDAMRQAETDDRARAAALAGFAEQLCFGYHEARDHVLRALEPVLRAMAQQVLPVAAQTALVPRVIEELLPFAGRAADAPVVLRVPSGAAALFEAGFKGHVLPPLELVETADLPPGSAEFAAGPQDVVIDLSQAAARCADAVTAFYQYSQSEKEPRDVASG
ncbi:MAG: flagellar biosynthesis protein [Pararhodobacter sp.]|nr:flagellar biosynthesis protein [Pararhodobacter sp.]